MLISGTLASSAVTSDKLADDSVGEEHLQQGSVGALAISPGAILLASDQITSNATTTQNTFQSTGLDITFDMPAGGRSVLLIFQCVGLYNSSSTTNVAAGLFDGALNGTQIAGCYGIANIGASAGGFMMALVTPTAGSSKTYRVGLKVSGGTGTLEASAATPARLIALLI